MLSSEMPLRLYPRKPAQRHAVHRVTGDLPNRVSLHKQDLIEGFTKKYRVHLLVYYDMHPTMEAAIRREKQLKECGEAVLEGRGRASQSQAETAVEAEARGREGAPEGGRHHRHER